MGTTAPLLFVVVISIVVGLLLVVIFRYTSNQKAIGRAKDQLKAHLLAVRLFQDQLPVVLRAYGQILLGTGSYLRLSFAPLLIIIVPLTLLIIQLDRYLGSMPIQPGQAFLVSAQVDHSDTLDQLQLQMPSELEATAPPVHIPSAKEVVWRIVAKKEGSYEVGIAGAGPPVSKKIVVSSALARLSSTRLRGAFWERLWSSAETPLPGDSAVKSISVTYLPRSIGVAGYEENWIVLFFIVSLISGFIFKSVLGIQI